MKSFFLCLFLCLSMSLLGQYEKNIQLAAPDTSAENSFLSVYLNRSSASDFTDIELSDEEISDLLWSANGINRPASGKRTAPSALNAQDIDIFLFSSDGVFLYIPENHELQMVSESDSRVLLVGESFSVVPPQVLLLVSDVSRFTFGTDEMRMEWAAIDAGIVTQNILLFCSWNNILARPRSVMEKDKIIRLLGLSDSQHVLLNIPLSK